MKGVDTVLAGMRAGRPATGPLHVHIDVTNTCNAACVTCWDHSPLLAEARPNAWKRRRVPTARFHALLGMLDGFGSVQSVVISGMGEPLTHPDIYEMLAAVKARGWGLTLMTNLVAADIDRLAPIGIDQVLVGVQGASPTTHMAFHPGWTEDHFFKMCAHLRALARAGTRVRHVQVINRDTAPEVPEMVRFGRMFGADRVNFKLASLAEGTEACAITDAQRDWLLAEGIPEARRLAADGRVPTNLDLFERQVRASESGPPDARTSGRARPPDRFGRPAPPTPTLSSARSRASTEPGGELVTVPIAEVGCWMGYVYTRVTVDEEVLYCCNTEVKVGSLRDADLATLWRGPQWQALRDRLGAGDYLPGCERCGKFEQNVKWAARLREAG